MQHAAVTSREFEVIFTLTCSVITRVSVFPLSLRGVFYFTTQESTEYVFTIFLMYM